MVDNIIERQIECYNDRIIDNVIEYKEWRNYRQRDRQNKRTIDVEWQTEC